MAHSVSHSIARMEFAERVNRKVADLSATMEHKKAVMQNRLAIAKMEARQEIEARIAKRTHELSNTSAIIRRHKDSDVAGYALLTQMVLFSVYIAAVCKFV